MFTSQKHPAYRPVTRYYPKLAAIMIEVKSFWMDTLIRQFINSKSRCNGQNSC